jgi:hypothetical protein
MVPYSCSLQKTAAVGLDCPLEYLLFFVCRRRNITQSNNAAVLSYNTCSSEGTIFRVEAVGFGTR